MKEMAKGLGFFVVISALILGACTLFDFPQDVKRFNESTDGSLSNASNVDAPGTNDFHFAVFGDSHHGLDDTTELINRTGLSLINADSDIDFMVGLGDLTNSGRNHQYAGLKATIDELTSIPFYPVLGNHDVWFNGWDNFKQTFGRSVYTFTADHVTFIVVDSASSTMNKGQFEWLRDRLIENRDNVTIVATHVPVYTGLSGHYLLWDDPEQSYNFMQLCNQYNVDLVLQGHYHEFDDLTIGNVRFIVTGNWNTDIDGDTYHYLKIGVNGSGITVTKVDFSI